MSVFQKKPTFSSSLFFVWCAAAISDGRFFYVLTSKTSRRIARALTLPRDKFPLCTCNYAHCGTRRPYKPRVSCACSVILSNYQSSSRNPIPLFRSLESIRPYYCVSSGFSVAAPCFTCQLYAVQAMSVLGSEGSGSIIFASRFAAVGTKTEFEWKLFNQPLIV